MAKYAPRRYLVYYFRVIRYPSRWDAPVTWTPSAFPECDLLQTLRSGVARPQDQSTLHCERDFRFYLISTLLNRQFSALFTPRTER